MDVEMEQVKLRLTTNDEVLATLRTNKAFQRGKDGQEIFVRQFDSRMFEFVPGRILTVGATIARGLIQSSRVIVGNHLTGAWVPAIEKVSSFQASFGEPDENRSSTACAFCGTEFKTPDLSLAEAVRKLGHHMMTKHPELDGSVGVSDNVAGGSKHVDTGGGA